MRIKCEIIKNLPVSIYGGQRRKLAAGENLLADKERALPADKEVSLPVLHSSCPDVHENLR